MPWPPTGAMDSVFTLDEQLSSPDVPGLTDDADTAYTSEGTMSPNALDPTYAMFNALPKPGEQLIQPPDSNAQRQAVIDWASQWVDKAWYKWGGESMKEGGFDCSGLIWAAFKSVGISIPRVSYSQANHGTRVSIDDLLPGDLVAWENNPEQAGADHIAIYLGNGQILEAARTGTKIRIRKLKSNEEAWGVHINY